MRTERFQRELDDLIERGWDIEEERPDRIILVKRNFGSPGAHLLIALLTLWWTMGLGNVAYGAYKYFEDSDRRVLRDVGGTCPECGTSLPHGAAFCPSCGADVEEIMAETERTCPACGAEVPDQASYCMSCGTALTDETVDSV